MKINDHNKDINNAHKTSEKQFSRTEGGAPNILKSSIKSIKNNVVVLQLNQ